ncbi:nicotinate-nicotinamide nucleotide adenylyltransferase [Clostridium luticellarii]|uniref:nicotinate-nucleotide adenylyltransferase n=1 Tax=Clostridium luticellarii TaxID=1691940 RepID=A0A2T0BM33_9CLOT|nr:cytidyltransferase [Clostridium luticellarii]PRR84946.1 nicotinic acid mononucleotide adenylyltransferase [Clostridium luticellarii]
MSPISYTESYNRIFRKITNAKWLKKYSINKHPIDKGIKSSKFKDVLKTQIINNDFSAKTTLTLCQPMMEALLVHRTPDNLLMYIYQYILRKNFPENVTIEILPQMTAPCELYLAVFGILCEIQKNSQDGTWESCYPLRFLTSKEESQLEHPEEYNIFIKSFLSQNTYEMMKLNGELTGFTTLEHVCGVHYLSLYMARQLKSIDIPVDLGRVSGAAAGHDIGKYGCRYEESRRVPNLHYYYTDQWFKRCGINYIRNVAINHSVWDLELENLSLESLLLIYSDFRVKNEYKNGKTYMKLFSLTESFYVILNKLENMNPQKSKRYKKVYAKLRDFENFLLDIGIDINPKQTFSPVKQKTKNYTLLQGNEIVQNLKYLSINHNINLMYQLRDEYSLDAILEMARSENDWKVLREYIGIFQEYSTYLTQKQKLQTLKFLYENLIHPEDDIRRRCAELIGNLIATFDEDYRKALPRDVKIPPPITSSISLLKEYLEIMLSPSHKVISSNKLNIGYSISIMVNSLFENCKKSLIVKYIDVLMEFYKDEKHRDISYEIFLIETSKHIPCDYLSGENEEILFSYIFSRLKNRNITIRIEILEAVLAFSDKFLQKRNFLKKIKNYFNSITTRSKIAAENFLLFKINKKLNLADVDIFEYYCNLSPKVVTDIFLSNLKTATGWIKKKNQVELLLHYALSNPQTTGIHTAIHFCNLLKVSALESVRNTAGSAILKIMPYLSLAERNEVAVELLRALEIEGNRFTEYIPRYTGQAALWLQPKELDEFIDDSIYKVKTSNSNLKSLILKTIGIIIAHYWVYKDRFEETETLYLKRLNKMLGILLNGLVDCSSQVKQAAFSVIGREIFGCASMDLTKKELIFKLIAKKVLTLITHNENQEILFLTRAASLNHIYRFISDFNFFYGDIDIPVPSKVAFFPGTFDPFSLSHKEIAKSIRDLGFEVYLAVDEFSWSKKTLPNLLRRNLVTMSVASELGIYVYPDMYPTNISNEANLRSLKENFPNSKIYMCIGSDVLINASSYRAPKTRNSIHTFSHIIFEREKDRDLLRLATKKIEGNVIILGLTSKYSNISSSQIRTSIDSNRDISTLVDPMVEQYIYANGFYQRESQDKDFIRSLWLDKEVFEELSQEVLDKISQCIPDCSSKLINKIKEISSKSSFCIVFLKNTNTKEILGFCIMHWIVPSMLYEEFKSTSVCSYIRENSTGRIVSIDGICIKNKYKSEKLAQILLTEAISIYVSKNYEYAVYKNAFDRKLYDKNIFSLLEFYGFIKVPFCDESSPIYAVNMSSPCIVNFDIQNIIKDPLRSNAKIMDTLTKCRRKLIESMAKLYPGELIISFNVNFVYQCLIRKICEENMVPTYNTSPRKLGDAMCVPYGDILERYVIPNTVTKSLHTEKLFSPDMKKFVIGEFPHYLNLNTQIKMIKAFQRPVILVDDLLHKGYRIRAVEPIFKNEDVKIQKIIVAVLSGKGKDLMDMQGRSVESVYFIPRLKLWFNENSLYPFIGGDALFRGSYPERNLFPSINLILPYTYPTFIKNTSKSNIYNLSKTCVENSLSILETIEEEYHLIHEKNLTLSCLGQVFATPRCPDPGENMSFNLNLPASSYLKNHLELLARMEHAFE